MIKPTTRDDTPIMVLKVSVHLNVTFCCIGLETGTDCNFVVIISAGSVVLESVIAGGHGT